MSDLMMVVNLIFAFILSGTIGWLREMEGKSAGLRTHILVGTGATLFMILSGEMITISQAADPGRIAASVAMGVGFIGAGCILQGENKIKGITTASSIWITAAIGVAIGTGLYVAAIATTIITAITLHWLGKVEHRITKTKGFE
ncbi:MAG: MgtC/SapB family protein [bacterium]